MGWRCYGPSKPAASQRLEQGLRDGGLFDVSGRGHRHSSDLVAILLLW